MLAFPIAPTEADKSNLALGRLRDGRIDDGFVQFAAGDGEIRRVSASVHGRRLATLGCWPSPNETDCSGPQVIVWQFEDPLTVPSRVLSLAADDFECSRPGGRERCVPSRIALSPDGQWLVVSFKQAGQLLVVPARSSPQGDAALRRQMVGKSIRSGCGPSTRPGLSCQDRPSS
jgi:hypothetical protein